MDQAKTAMNKIIEFLQTRNNIELLNESKIKEDSIMGSFNAFNSKLKVPDKNLEFPPVQLKPDTERLSEGQIWLCKQEYFDCLGNLIEGKIPYLVLIVSEIGKLEDTDFIRVQPISPFLDFKADDEIIITDEKIIGFKFIIETWNEQPILKSILSEYAGSITYNLINPEIDTDIELNEDQINFRKVEIQNTAYLRHSIISLMEFIELSHDSDVFINIENSLNNVAIIENRGKVVDFVEDTEMPYLQAAKKGKYKERTVYKYKDLINKVPVEFIIIKDNNKYTLAVKHPLLVELIDNLDQSVVQKNTNIFNELESGLYFLRSKELISEIRILLR